jgi:hypothetical protein
VGVKRPLCFGGGGGKSVFNYTNQTLGAKLCRGLKSGHFGKQIRNTWKGFECGAGEGWGIAGPIV